MVSDRRSTAVWIGGLTWNGTMQMHHPAGMESAGGPGTGSLRFYDWLNRLPWPASYLGRLMLVCSLAACAPLILVLLAAGLATGGVVGLSPLMVALILGADLIGIGLMLIALRGALQPLQMSIAALSAYRATRRIPDLPAGYDDEAGRLMREIRSALMLAESAKADLARTAETDALTGIANRRTLMRIGERLISDARRSGPPFVVIVIDLDHFKRINDTHGHAAGDAVLRTVAGVVERNLRADTPFARLGGEEFAVIAPRTDLVDGLSIAERLRGAIAGLPMPALGGDHATASFGVTVFAAGDRDFEAILHRADMALYTAKNNGRNRVEAWSDPDDSDEPLIFSTGPLPKAEDV